MNQDLPPEIVFKTSECTPENIHLICNLLEKWSRRLRKIADQRTIKEAIRDSRVIFTDAKRGGRL